MKKNIFNKAVSLFFFALLISTTACERGEKAPISEDKLVEVLYDIHTAEALLESESQVHKDSMVKIYYPQIFEKQGITRLDFDSTMAVYSRNTVKLDTVYNRVLRMVAARKDILHK